MRLGRSAELVFVLGALTTVGFLFLLAWLRHRSPDHPLASGSWDLNDWLLRCLLVLAAFILLGTLLFLLPNLLF